MALWFLNARIGFPSFVFSFLQEALDENVCHVKVFSKLRDIQMIFGIFLNDLAQGHFFWGSSHLLGFLHELAFFELTFIQIFRRFSNLGSLKFLHPIPLVYQ